MDRIIIRSMNRAAGKRSLIIGAPFQELLDSRAVETQAELAERAPRDQGAAR